MFGVNFIDGRIKGYPAASSIGKKYYVLYVRGNTKYGIHQYVDNGNGTITDDATGLMWMQTDNGTGILWEKALSYAEGFEYAGYTDWRLPNAKELQSIVDYTRSPATTNSAAIDPLFNCTKITNEAGDADYPFYWSGTTFCSQTTADGKSAAYLSFGKAMGYMFQLGGWIDVHGAGAQRSDPKTGNPADYPNGHGPQGDAIRIYNFVRLVRTADQNTRVNNGQAYLNSIPTDFVLNQNYPNPFNPITTISFSLPRAGQVSLKIYNILGEMIARLVEDKLAAGNHIYKWNAEELAGGVYYYKLIAGSNRATTKMLLLR